MLPEVKSRWGICLLLLENLGQKAVSLRSSISKYTVLVLERRFKEQQL